MWLLSDKTGLASRGNMLHPKYYGVGIRIRARQEGIGNRSHGLRTAYRDRAPIPLELGSGQPTLRHRRVPDQVPAQAGKAQVLPRRKSTLVVIIRTDKPSEGNGNARSCESRSQNRSGVVSRGTAQRNNTTSREPLYRRRRLRGPRRYCCITLSGDMWDHATTRILAIDTRLWR